MENKLQQLTQKLYDEGLEKGRAEAERLVAEAKTNAAKIVKEAEAQAAKILAEANTKAQDVEKNAMTEISLAGKQALSKIKAEISSMIIAKSTAPAVKAATLDPEFVKQMLLTVAKNWSGADSSKNQLKALLPEAEQKAFEATFEAAAKELLAAGVEVGYSKEVRTGFKVGAKDGGYYISFSDQDFDALLKEYLRDKVYKMLSNAYAGRHVRQELLLFGSRIAGVFARCRYQGLQRPGDHRGDSRRGFRPRRTLRAPALRLLRLREPG